MMLYEMTPQKIFPLLLTPLAGCTPLPQNTTIPTTGLSET